MADFTVRSDSVDVEQIMRQIRARIREKRGVDYTEAEVQQLASVKLEKFLDPKGVRSDLVEQYRKQRAGTPEQAVAELEATFYASHRPRLQRIRKLLNPILKLFINPAALAQALEQVREREALTYEVIHNLVVETTRLGIEVHNLKMRVESLSSRVDFDERRARALEGVVQYRRGPAPPRGPGGRGGQESRSPGGQEPRSPGGQEPRSPGAQEARSAGAQDLRSPAETTSPEGLEPRAAGQEPRGSVEPRGPGEQRGPGGPGGGPGGPGSGEPRRRRRRRRRRRPGQDVADRTSASPQGAPGSSEAGSPGREPMEAEAGGGPDDGAAWDGDEPGADEQ
jgi:hypothetical protein